MPGPEGWRLFASHRLIIADLRHEPADWQQPGFDDSGWPAATITAAHPAPERPTLRFDTIPPLTVVDRPALELIDAGVARGGGEVKLAEDVAIRLAAQAHETLVRPATKAPVVFERAGKQIYHLPCPKLMTKLGWRLPAEHPDGVVSPMPAMPLEIPAVDGDFFLTLDIGRQTSGCAWLEVETGTDLTVDVAYGDCLDAGRVNPRSERHSLADRVLLPPGRRWIRLPHDRGCRYLQVSFSGGARLHGIGIEEHLYPHDEVRRFTCSDPTLNRIWDAAVATLHSNSLWSHVDNARRERQGWAGPDITLSSRGFMAAFGDTRLTRKQLEDYCDYFEATGNVPNFYPAVAPWVHAIASHDLWLPEAAWRYVLIAGDTALARRLLPACEAVLNRIAKLDADGLLGSAGGWRWAEWNLMSAEAICTWENLLAVQAWRGVANLREFLGAHGADDACGAADALGRAIARRLWHPRHRALAQGTRADGSLCDFCSQIDNALALLLGILPEEQRRDALRFCGGPSGLWPTNRSGWQGGAIGERVRHDPRLPVVAGSPGLSDLCARAIFAQQTADDGIDYIRRNYGQMLDENGGTFSECWSTPADEAACKSQDWGGALAATLIEEVVGLRPAAPGCRRLVWRPPVCRLSFAEGRFDTPLGPVTVRWEADGALRYDVPEGVSLEIRAKANVLEA
ncbi:MAG TPA: alpha-L-rhamnosidase C-terminal domain-containing protein [Phycisphaerae bacterium]|nr:alpha-L-rhamnosidase C-terminal domain-containing protein [Phycisphaerae bacterium]